MMEAVPDDSVLMKYKLFSADRNLIYWPVIDNVDEYYIVTDTHESVNIIPTTDNYNNETYDFHFPNVEHFNMVAPGLGSGKVTGGTDNMFVPGAGIPYDVTFYGQKTVKFTCAVTDTPVAANINITGAESGAPFTTIVYCNPNKPKIAGTTKTRT